MPFTALAIGAGAGLLKSEFVDKPREDRQRQLASATQRYSPWTGLRANPIQEADPLGSALQYGATGAQLGAGMQNAQAQNDLAKAQTNWLNKNPYNYNTASNSSLNTFNPSGPNPYMNSPWRL